jgi:hypothetical protein
LGLTAERRQNPHADSAVLDRRGNMNGGYGYNMHGGMYGSYGGQMPGYGGMQNYMGEGYSNGGAYGPRGPGSRGGGGFGRQGDGGGPRSAPVQRGSEYTEGKLFLGGLDNATTKESLYEYCMQWYGAFMALPLPRMGSCNRPYVLLCLIMTGIPARDPGWRMQQTLLGACSIWT